VTLVFLLNLTASFSPVRAAEPLAPVDKAWLEANYIKEEFQISMRDGIKLFTIVYEPKDASVAWPIWMVRTAYGAGPRGTNVFPNPGGPRKYYAREKFIFVLQDVRGRHGSEGSYVDTRPLRTDPSGPGETDESTDAWDTIDWLVKHIANNNGRVGVSGISDPGFYAGCAAVNNHPALKAVSPQAPVTDSFVGDDFHHNGAFFLPHAFGFYSSFGRKAVADIDYGTPDGYEFYLQLGPLANLDARYFKGRNEFWNDLMQHGTRDEFYQARDPAPRLKNIHAAMLTVGGWFDAEDLYGALRVYRAVQRQDPGIVNQLVMGPWSHGAWSAEDTRHFGALDFGSNPAEFFRQNIELPFFKHYLKDAPATGLPKAYMFETGANRWRAFTAWPPTNAVPRTLCFQPGGRLAFTAPTAGDAVDGGFDEYISDPARPVPYYSRIALGMAAGYMADDQRFAATRPDVLVYQTEPLATEVTLAGPVSARLRVSTSGTDSDWIVKLIDVYPSDFPEPEPNPRGLVMGGYQQLVRGEPMRGKFRRSFEKPEPFTPGEVTPVNWVMPDIFHTFRRGHRIMVQVQSTWFPLVDRNPQTFCDIYHAKAEDFRKATERVYHSAAAPSKVDVSVLPGEN
jgi:putative CocE/NonD family hydrolase